jgi:hypothetical protein
MKTPTNAASLLCHPGFAPLPTGASSARDSLPPAGAVGKLLLLFGPIILGE